jgi:nitroreductase
MLIVKTMKNALKIFAFASFLNLAGFGYFSALAQTAQAPNTIEDVRSVKLRNAQNLGAVVQKTNSIELPTRNIKTLDFLFAIENRISTRNYSDKSIDAQELSNILWCAGGLNRKDGGRTAPSSHGKKLIDIYVFTEKGVFLYSPEKNELETIVDKDLRELVALQDYAIKAPLNLLYVANYARMGDDAREKTEPIDKMRAAAIEAGAISQNVALYCAAQGRLGSVVRTSMKMEELAKTFEFKDNMQIIGAQTIGYKEKIENQEKNDFKEKANESDKPIKAKNKKSK